MVWLYYILTYHSQPVKLLKSNTGVFVELAFNVQCYIVKNTLLHAAFSANLPAGIIPFRHGYIKMEEAT